MPAVLLSGVVPAVSWCDVSSVMVLCQQCHCVVPAVSWCGTSSVIEWCGRHCDCYMYEDCSWG